MRRRVLGFVGLRQDRGKGKTGLKRTYSSCTDSCSRCRLARAFVSSPIQPLSLSVTIRDILRIRRARSSRDLSSLSSDLSSPKEAAYRRLGSRLSESIEITFPAFKSPRTHALRSVES